MTSLIEKKREKTANKKKIITTLFVVIAFCIVSLLSRFILPLFLIVLIVGITFPLLWAKKTNTWTTMGFKQPNKKQALRWGFFAGLIPSIYCVISYVWEGGGPAPPMLEIQLILGIPIWLLIMSPFQEFLFRGWLQPRFQESLGRWLGLGVTSFIFALWHLFPPFEGTQTSTIPIFSPSSMITIFAFSMIWGYCFQRTNNIITPWLAHAIAGITMVALGKMTFITYTI